MTSTEHIFKYHRPFKISLIVAALFFWIISIFFSGQFLVTRQKSINESFKQAGNKTEQAAQKINEFLEKLKPLVDQLSEQLSKNQLSEDQIKSLLTKKTTDISGLGVLYFKPWRALYYLEYEGAQKVHMLEQPENKAEWYQQIKTGSFGLFVDPKTDNYALYYGTPLFNEKKEQIGVVFATQSVAHLKHILSTLYLGQAGYWFLTDKEGKLLIHPYSSWVMKHKSVRDIAHASQDDQILGAFEQTVAQKKQHSITYDNEVTGNESWIFFQPVNQSSLILAGVFDKNELPLSNTLYRTSLIRIILAIIIGCCFLILLIPLRSAHPSNHSLWLTSVFGSLLLLITIAIIWLLAQQYPLYEQSSTPIVSKAHLYAVLDEFQKERQTSLIKKEKVTSNQNYDEFGRLLAYRYKEGKYIPTGILVNDLQMKSQDTIEFVGYIWQRYFDGIHDGVSRGFLLPQIADKPTITQISKSKHEKAEVIIWQVRATLNQQFSYRSYPFDVKNIDIQLRHKDFEKKVILVPDLDAYPIINQTALPGIGKDTHLTNWHLLKSNFGYQLEQFNTNFGLYSYGPFGVYSEISLDHEPELTFNIVTQRYLVDTLISDLLPPCVIAVILFVLLLTYFAEGTFELLLETSAAAFFSTVFAQIQFRSKIPSHEFVYFEIFYFTLYLAILTILITTLLHMFKMETPIISYRNNLVTKLLYWPLMLTVILAVTLYYLY